MSEFAVRAEQVSKLYHLGERESYKALRDTLTDMANAPFRALSARVRRRNAPAPNAPPPDTDLWALRDVSFAVGHGEVVGIIGRNGAGKSTLLKVLSRITEPTSGRAVMRGRLASLLEVGTGFHPELTGRENIYLNGAILGMKRAEINRHFDEIVAFAELARFIDTPVKRYSSGMYVRLAFAVAAHLESEILIVDEVLAVGDGSFQKKCLAKIQDVGRQGRTVLFVSHDMSAITRLCERAILLDAGRVIGDGPAHQVVSAYLQSGVGMTAMRVWSDPRLAPGNGIARLYAARVHTEDGVVADAFDIRRPIGVTMEYDVLQPGHVLVPNYHFFNEEGQNVFVVNDHDPAWWRRPRPLGRFASTAWIPGNFLAEGSLLVGTALSTMDPVVIHFYERDAVTFHVTDSLDGDSARGDYAGPMPGAVRPVLEWRTHYTAAAGVDGLLTAVGRGAEGERR